MIDNIPTIITHVTRNIAKGFIVGKDLSLKPCYIAKGHNLFAHGKTMRKAVQDLQEKVLGNLSLDEVIKEFTKNFNNIDTYEGTEFYKWHNILTGSCEAGRDNFVTDHELNLEDKFTVKEFIKLCENDYGGEIIKKLKQYYI